MPIGLEIQLKKEAMKKFGTIQSDRAKSYIYGTLNKIKQREKNEK